jgi:DNA-binding transcriptional LysR family regulator
MNGGIDWNCVRDFLAVVEAGNLTRAAVGLRVSQPTLSRRLTALEEQVGAQLLIRGPRHLELTDAGRRILNQARRMDREASDILESARDAASSLSGTVRISATEAFSSLWLIQQLSDFMGLYPDINVELIADNQLTDLLGRDADVAIRLVEPTQKDLVARKVGTMKMGIYAIEQYVERYGNPRRISELASHRVIAIAGRRQFAARIDRIVGTENTVFRVRNVQAVLTAVRAGIGMGPLYAYLGEEEPDLIRVLADEPVFEMGIWLAALPDLNEVARVRALFDYLVAAFVAQRQRFS